MLSDNTFLELINKRRMLLARTMGLEAGLVLMSRENLEEMIDTYLV